MRKEFPSIVLYSLLVTILCPGISHSKKKEIKPRPIKDLLVKSFLLGTNTSGDLWLTEGNYVKSCSNNGDVVFITKRISITNAFADVVYVAMEMSNVKIKNYVFNKSLEIYLCNRTTELSSEGADLKLFFKQKCSFIYTANNSNVKNRNASGTKGEILTYIFKFHKKSWNNISLAVRGISVCARVYSIKLYYYYCEENIKEGIKFPKTMSPIEGWKNVEANCSINSSPSNQRKNQSGLCGYNGTWKIEKDMGCVCNKGYYEPNSSNICTPCPSNHYKGSLNGTCQSCPDGSISTANRTSCECKKGHYHLTDKENPTTAKCFGPIKNFVTKLENISYETITQVEVRWRAVNVEKELNHSLRYDVQCFRCNETCNQACKNVTYEPRQNNLTEPFVRILNLRPGYEYKVRVYPKTAIYKFIEKTNWSYAETGIFSEKNRNDESPTDENAETQSSNSLLSDYVVISGIASGVLFIMIVLLIVVVVKRKSGYRDHLIVINQNQVELPQIGHKLYVDPTIYDSPEDALNEFASELDPSVLVLEKLIGGGEFGDVYKGVMKCSERQAMAVAVKTLKNDHTAKNQTDFLLEASVMGQFNDPNVIRLEGVITKSFPRMIVTEYMSNGSLDHFLRLNEDNLSDMQLIGMAQGVASGMAYLSGMSFIHRDLAARNILVSDDLLCKIADFGLSRSLESDGTDGEYNMSGGKIPVRWTAPEVIAYRKFSSSSDVWSFGILLWEIMSLGDRPYWEWDNHKVMQEVEEGFRLPAPKDCPRAVHNLMLSCWKAIQSERPKFEYIAQLLNGWIRSPETMSEDGRDSIIGEWLHSIKMGDYTTLFLSAGYENPYQLVGIQNGDLLKIGVRLIGHRNKILKTIRAFAVSNDVSMTNALTRTESIAV